MKRKVLAMFLAVSMAMAMPCMAFAEETVNQVSEVSKTYNMSFEEKGKVAHTYKVYQIFTGTLAEIEGKNILSDIEWGSSVKAGGISIDGENYAKADVFAKYLKDLNDAQLESIRGQIFGAIDTSKAVKEFTSVAGSKTNVELPAGYYILEDVTPEDKLEDKTTGTKDTKSSYVIQLVGNVEVAAKVGSVISEKKVDDINDSTNASEKLQDTADYDIGDAVPFTITGTIPANYNKYKTFYYAFNDKMEKGLTFNNDVKVFLGESEISADKYVVETPNAQEFKVIFNNLKDVAGVTADSKITVKYTCTLNENCVVGSQGNINESWLVYSNNPDVEGFGETSHDNNIVFTYKVVVNKVDDSEPHRPLAGAEFKIEKLVKVNGNDTWVEKKFEVNQEGTQFSITGVDDGIYKLTETKAPEGYNMIKEPFYFVVGATHDFNRYIDSNNRGNILNLEAYQVDGDNNYVKVDTVVLEFTSNKTSGEVSTDVVNTSGSILPSTGGMGTTVFYLLGGVLVIGAGVVLFTRRRVDAQN